VLDVGALRNWFDIYADVPEEELKIIHPPYKVGLMALEAISVSGYFDAAVIQHRMIQEYLPERIMRMETRNAAGSGHPTSTLADIGLFMAYQNTLFESSSVEDAETTLMEARAQAMERTEAFRGIVRSSGVDGLLVRPEDDPHLELPMSDAYYARSTFKAGELLIASGLFTIPNVRIA
jgi:hypothetical protein